jgi:hypothetical protein
MRQTTKADLGLVDEVEVRLWDEDRNLVHTLTERFDPADGALTLPGDHPAAQWLVSLNQPDVYASIDRGPDRLLYTLDEWRLEPSGPCPECAHCAGPKLVTRWRKAMVESAEGWTK